MVNGSFRVGFGAAFAGQLGKETCFVQIVQSTRFFLCVEVRDVVNLPVETLLFSQSVRLRRLQDLRGTEAGFAPPVMVDEFCTLRRCRLPVSGMAHGICLLYAFVDDSTALIAVLLPAIDDAFTGERSVNLIDGVL